jgi:hypothetical protein
MEPLAIHSKLLKSNRLLQMEPMEPLKSEKMGLTMKKPSDDLKQISARKLAANQRNAEESTGPHNCNLTRYNAAKHGLLAEGVTEMDDPASFHKIRSRIETDFAPVGEVENMLVDRIALGRVRLRRAAMLEAEFITATLNPVVRETIYPDGSNMSELDKMLERDYGKTVVLDPGLPARLSASDVETLVEKFQRYETAIENKLYRALNQLERLQRMRRGDKIPAPASLDVNVHHEHDDVGSFGNPTSAAGD